MDDVDDVVESATSSRPVASELWAELVPHSFQEQYHLIRTHRRFVTWTFCERLCQESVRLTVIDPDRAVEAAELAVLVSDLLKEREPSKARGVYRLRSYAWAHDGNARRVLGDLRAAEESFSIAGAWWDAAQTDTSEARVYEPALLDLEASLRIAQRRFAEALSLLNRLISLHLDDRRPEKDTHLAGRAMIKKALALAEMEEPERAIELLQLAEPMVDMERDPRLLLCLRHNLLWNFTTVEEHGKAEALLPEVAALSRELGNPLDLARLRWAEARIAAGLGNKDAAMRLFQQLGQEFVDRGMAYDAALVTLELTALHLQVGHIAEVKRLSIEMAEIFRAQDVPREALAALLFFRKAAERESATVRLAREVAAFLEKRRADPGLRFDLTQ